MISLTKAMTFLLLSAATLRKASAKCSSYYYQKGSSDNEFAAYSFDHDTTSCTDLTRDSRQKLSDGNWETIKADKNHQSTIQVSWVWVDTDIFGNNVDKEKIAADLNEGVLTITIPKKEEEKESSPKLIPIKSGAASE